MTAWTRRLATGPHDIDGSYHVTSPATGSTETLCRGRWLASDAVEHSDNPGPGERCDECERVAIGQLRRDYIEAIDAARAARGGSNYDRLFLRAVHCAAALRRALGHCPDCSARPNERPIPTESDPVRARRTPPSPSPRWRPRWAPAQAERPARQRGTAPNPQR